MPFNDPVRKREYERKYQREWIAKRRAAWFEGKTCVRCGAPATHLRLPADAEAHGGSIWSMAKERREALLARCLPMCSSCRNIRKTPIGRLFGSPADYTRT
jgi:hypothetical protein